MLMAVVSSLCDTFCLFVLSLVPYLYSILMCNIGVFCWVNDLRTSWLVVGKNGEGGIVLSFYWYSVLNFVLFFLLLDLGRKQKLGQANKMLVQQHQRMDTDGLSTLLLATENKAYWRHTSARASSCLLDNRLGQETQWVRESKFLCWFYGLFCFFCFERQVPSSFRFDCFWEFDFVMLYIPLAFYCVCVSVRMRSHACVHAGLRFIDFFWGSVQFCSIFFLFFFIFLVSSFFRFRIALHWSFCRFGFTVSMHMYMMYFLVFDKVEDKHSVLKSSIPTSTWINPHSSSRHGKRCIPAPFR